MESAGFGPSLGPLKHLIDDIQYYTFPYTNITVCLLLLRDGKGLIGMSDLPVKDFTTDESNAAALQDALVKLIRLECDQTDADSDSVPTINGEPFEAVKGPRPSK